MDVEGWKDEMVGIRKMIAQFATIDPCDITGNKIQGKMSSIS